ncbi:hypothetical protein F2Q70_00017900 [Brassica cretica]|uniref:Uncharacterized protein n=1 Tax=Brassica cretica TaxID=69181 RepID=A0A8S9KUB4_BRACR|nr:hypothetical protein F2Q70_00017900 [Brassica cretica]KAF2598009.1 hypothetical protein F2Q68_00010879 [Brassica cretica]
MLSDLKAVVVAPPSRGLLRFWESRSISLVLPSVPYLRSRKASARDRDLICVFCGKQQRKQFSSLPSTNGFSVLLIQSSLPSLQPTKGDGRDTKGNKWIKQRSKGTRSRRNHFV